MGIYLDKENYLEALCIAHPIIQHTAIVAGKERNSFFRINNDNEIDASVLDNIAYPCVADNSIKGNIKDVGNALQVIEHVFKNSWLFLDYLDPNVSEDGQGTADRLQLIYDSTFSIMEDFIKAMKDDYETNGNCGAFIAFDIEKISYAQIGPFVQNEYGWILYFEDIHPASRIMDGNNNVWGGGISISSGIQPEIIPIVNENNKEIDWTIDRKQKYGIMPLVEVYLVDNTGKYYLAAVQPTLDAAPPSFTTMYFSFDKIENGFIIIK